MTTLEKHILSLQQKVEQLNSEIITLIALTSAEQSTVHKRVTSKSAGQATANTSSFANKSSVGIDRYRQLRANE